jgi:uncharacterized protein YegP (UPF0339 family)
MRFEIYRSGFFRKEWRWRFIATNGRTIAVSSEGYADIRDCRSGVRLMQGSGAAPVVEIGKD